MELLYTNSSKFLGVQEDGFKSLGGYISISEVQNDLTNSLFGAISKNLIWHGRPEYRAIVLHNDTTSTISNLKVFLAYPTADSGDSDADPTDWQAEFTAAYEVPSSDDCANISISKISSPNSKPYSLTFANIDGLVNALNLPNLAPDGYLGLWLCRSIKSSAKLPLTDDQYLAILNGTLVLPTQEDVELVVQFA